MDYSMNLNRAAPMLEARVAVARLFEFCTERDLPRDLIA
jgi:hypothetical protein